MKTKRGSQLISSASTFYLRQREMDRRAELRVILQRAGVQDVDSYLAAKVADFRRRSHSS